MISIRANDKNMSDYLVWISIVFAVCITAILCTWMICRSRLGSKYQSVSLSNLKTSIVEWRDGSQPSCLSCIYDVQKIVDKGELLYLYDRSDRLFIIPKKSVNYIGPYKNDNIQNNQLSLTSD